MKIFISGGRNCWKMVFEENKSNKMSLVSIRKNQDLFVNALHIITRENLLALLLSNILISNQ